MWREPGISCWLETQRHLQALQSAPSAVCPQHRSKAWQYKMERRNLTKAGVVHSTSGSQGAEEARAVARMLQAGAGSWAEAAAAQAEFQWLPTLTELCRAQSSSEGRWREMRTGINYRKTDRAHTCHKWKKIEKQSQPSIVIKSKWFGLWMRGWEQTLQKHTRIRQGCLTLLFAGEWTCCG